jgi:hypothetical protein
MTHILNLVSQSKVDRRWHWKTHKTRFKQIQFCEDFSYASDLGDSVTSENEVFL